MRSKSGFTLSEVLITLGLIGIVAAMTVPTIFGKINRTRTEAILKEDYSILQQVVKLAESEGATIGTIPDNIQGMQQWFQTFFEPYSKTSAICYNRKGCWSTTGSKTLNGGNVYYDHGAIGIGNNVLTVRLQNGSNLCFDGYSQWDIKRMFGVNDENKTSSVIFIDTNGDKLPNTIGKDIYILVWKDNKLVPAGTDQTTENIDKNCSVQYQGNNAGYYCLKKISNNNWKIPKDIEY